MSVKQQLTKLFARKKHLDNQKWINNPIAYQYRMLKTHIRCATTTQFGKQHRFDAIKTYKDFTTHIPIRNYEQWLPYIKAIKQGQHNVLWRGKPLYLSETSGTTSGKKYIPISKESMLNHIVAARDALLSYVYQSGNTSFVRGKQLFLQGNPNLKKGLIPTGRLSGIVAHHVPFYLKRSRLPSWKTNCLNDWEEKVNAIINETVKQKMTLIAGIPPWLLMYFDKLVQKTGRLVGELFPDFSLMVYGGVNYKPYKNMLENLIGRAPDTIELFPASEGFFAYQDIPQANDMLLLTNNGIFFEFIPVSNDNKHEQNSNRIPLEGVELGVNYAMIITTNAGLWAYELGDTVIFTSKAPYRLIVTGRTKHFISAFGEHVISKEVEQAINIAIKTADEPISIREFTVAPQVNPKEGLPHHEWFIEFDNTPSNLDQFAQRLDTELQNQNAYYKDLITGKVLCKAHITKVRANGFNDYMKSMGKLGGQNKMPRLSNNRIIADAMKSYFITQ